MERKWERNKKGIGGKRRFWRKLPTLQRSFVQISLYYRNEKRKKKNQRFDQCLQWPWFSMEKKGDCRKQKINPGCGRKEDGELRCESTLFG